MFFFFFNDWIQPKKIKKNNCCYIILCIIWEINYIICTWYILFDLFEVFLVLWKLYAQKNNVVWIERTLLLFFRRVKYNNKSFFVTPYYIICFIMLSSLLWHICLKYILNKLYFMDRNTFFGDLFKKNILLLSL